MSQENFHEVKANVSNEQNRDPSKSFYVTGRAYGHAAATTDIIRVTPKNKAA